MATMPADDPIGALVHDLKTGDKRKRIRAATILGKFGPRASSAVPDLIDGLQDDVITVRKEAAIALGKIGSAAMDAVPALSSLTEQRIVGHRAKKAIKQITGE